MTAQRLAGLTIVALVAALSACGPDDTPVSTEQQFELGTRRVQVSVPAGWDALDQGRQKRFRKGEFEIVLQDLGSNLRTPPPRNLDELIDEGLVALGHDQRREVKSRTPATIDGREAVDIETWNRLDHTNPRKITFVHDDGDLLALHTVGMAFDDSLVAFAAIRASLHFVSARQ